VAIDTKKNGMTLPTGILRTTTQPEPEGQGADDLTEEGLEPEATAKPPKSPKKSKGKATAAADEIEGLKLYLK
jgi:hypothetical protein